MTFRVIEGGGRARLPAAGTIEEARAEIIDRVAAAIWARQDEYPDPAYANWKEMKSLAAADPSRGHLVRTTLAQARAAIAALVVSAPPEAEHLLFKEIGLDPESAANAMAVIDDFVAAVLK